jgi:hypothetical protein
MDNQTSNSQRLDDLEQAAETAQAKAHTTQTAQDYHAAAMAWIKVAELATSEGLHVTAGYARNAATTAGHGCDDARQEQTDDWRRESACAAGLRAALDFAVMMPTDDLIALHTIYAHACERAAQAARYLGDTYDQPFCGMSYKAAEDYDARAMTAHAHAETLRAAEDYAPTT